MTPAMHPIQCLNGRAGVSQQPSAPPARGGRRDAHGTQRRERQEGTRPVGFAGDGRAVVALGAQHHVAGGRAPRPRPPLPLPSPALPPPA
eukprot:195163-Pyramimonas_sp.AAC.1